MVLAEFLLCTIKARIVGDRSHAGFAEFVCTIPTPYTKYTGSLIFIIIRSQSPDMLLLRLCTFKLAISDSGAVLLRDKVDRQLVKHVTWLEADYLCT